MLTYYSVNLCNILLIFTKKGFNFMKSPNAKGIRLGAAIRRMRRERSLTQTETSFYFRYFNTLS